MKIIHVVAGLWKDTGGPAEVIPNLCMAQAEAGMDVTLVSIDGNNAVQLEALSQSTANLVLVKAVDNIIRYAPDLHSVIADLGEPDIIHNHGHWLYPNWCASKIARQKNKVLVTTPHGTLVPGMLQRARFKKQIAWGLFDRHLISSANAIHALSEAERDAMSIKIGPAAGKCIVIPNGVHTGSMHRAEARRDDDRVLLFLSRLAPIKGVMQLVRAWYLVQASLPNWRLKMVGPVDEVIRHELAKFDLEEVRIDVVGPVYGDDRWAHYDDADAFVLPTLGEGLPTVLLEAAAHGLAIITTQEANFPALVDAGACRLTKPTVPDLAQDLEQFLSASEVERSVLASRAHRLIADQFSWSKIGQIWGDQYAALLKEKRA